MIRRLARIASTNLGVEDHGIFTAWLQLELDGGGSWQGAGGYALDAWKDAAGERVGTAEGLTFIKRVLETVGVEKWEDLKGRIVYALYDEPYRHNDPIAGLAGFEFSSGKGKQFIFKSLWQKAERVV